MCGAICGPSRGRYGTPSDVNRINWIDENGDPTTPPAKHRCEHPKHWQWGPGTRNGQKLIYPVSEMYWQKWELTEAELNEALDHYDMFSLDMPSRIICLKCASIEIAKALPISV